MPEDEVPAGAAKEGELAIGASEADRILHDTIRIHTVSQTEGVPEFVNRLLFQAVEDRWATGGGPALLIAMEAITRDHRALTLELGLAKHMGKDWVKEIRIGYG